MADPRAFPTGPLNPFNLAPYIAGMFAPASPTPAAPSAPSGLASIPNYVRETAGQLQDTWQQLKTDPNRALQDYSRGALRSIPQMAADTGTGIARQFTGGLMDPQGGEKMARFLRQTPLASTGTPADVIGEKLNFLPALGVTALARSGLLRPPAPPPYNGIYFTRGGGPNPGTQTPVPFRVNPYAGPRGINYEAETLPNYWSGGWADPVKGRGEYMGRAELEPTSPVTATSPWASGMTEIEHKWKTAPNAQPPQPPQGVASGIYDAMARNHTVVPSEILTTQGQDFWHATNPDALRNMVRGRLERDVLGAARNQAHPNTINNLLVGYGRDFYTSPKIKPMLDEELGRVRNTLDREGWLRHGEGATEKNFNPPSARTQSADTFGTTPPDISGNPPRNPVPNVQLPKNMDAEFDRIFNQQMDVQRSMARGTSTPPTTPTDSLLDFQYDPDAYRPPHFSNEMLDAMHAAGHNPEDFAVAHRLMHDFPDWRTLPETRDMAKDMEATFKHYGIEIPETDVRGWPRGAASWSAQPLAHEPVHGWEGLGPPPPRDAGFNQRVMDAYTQRRPMLEGDIPRSYQGMVNPSTPLHPRVESTRDVLMRLKDEKAQLREQALRDAMHRLRGGDNYDPTGMDR